MTEAALVTNLLEVIAQDDLYDAVLDLKPENLSENKSKQMNTNDIATDLGRIFTARDNSLMGRVVIGDMVDRLYAVHNALKTKHASGELTDGQYTENADELLGCSTGSATS